MVMPARKIFRCFRARIITTWRNNRRRGGGKFLPSGSKKPNRRDAVASAAPSIFPRLLFQLHRVFPHAFAEQFAGEFILRVRRAVGRFLAGLPRPPRETTEP